MMKKRVFVMAVILLSLCVTQTAYALPWKDCVFELLAGRKEVVGLKDFDDYTVGEVIEVARLTLGYWLPEGGQRHYGIAEGVKYYVDGQQVTDKYLCESVGDHKITLRKDDLIAEKSFHVMPKIKGKEISEIKLVKALTKTSFRSNLDPFQPEDVKVKCSFTSGEPAQTLSFRDLAFYCVPRGKTFRKFEETTPIPLGYIFTEPGKKDLIIRVASHSIRVPITVVSATKGASKVQMKKEPSQLTYVVGEGFKMSDYVVRCKYPDGSYKDYSDKNIIVSANGVRLYDGYKFTAAGEKNLVVSFGDFKQQYALNVKAKTEVVNTPKSWWYKVGEGFRMSEFTIRCNYEGGSFKDFSGEELSITANGVKMYEGYKFKQPGDKKLIVKYGSFAKEYTLKVVDANSPMIEMAKEPITFNYKVGEGFKMSEYSVICKYSDGSSKVVSGKELSITANGVKMYEGYKFKEAGTKKLVVKYGDFSKQYTLNVKSAGKSDATSNNPYAELARNVLYYTNEERAKHGLTALTWDEEVAKVAQKYSEYMAKNKFLAHEGIDGSTPKTRMKDGEIKGYTNLGENLGMGIDNAKDIVKAWMESKGHRENILRPEYTHLGVGVARSDNGHLFWTQNFITY
jgi:uncharacterized protein YkwD